MAEELDWDVEAFDEAFQEVFENGMAKADFKARLVWLPNALKHNKPESPNVVRSWRVELDLLPECDLKNEAISRIREILETIGPSYSQAFDEVLLGDSRKPSPKASVKPSVKTMPNQEQEQEQQKALSPDGDLSPAPIENLVEIYHEVMTLNPKCKVLNNTRRTAIRSRWLEASRLKCAPFGYSTRRAGLDAWRHFFEVCAESLFLTGRSPPAPGRPPFVADIDFFFSPSGFAKCLENKYHREAA